jgi:anti-anti-sigma factor
MQNSKSILIVDDELDILSQLNTFLKQEGYDVISASNGESGLSEFIEHRPVICIIDYKMPGMDGLQLLRAIKHIDPKTEVILISGHADMQLAIQAIKEHSFDFLQKPINLDDVLEKIEEVFQNIEIKKNRGEVITGGILLHRTLDRPIPISEITMTMDLDEITAPLFAAELESLLVSNQLEKQFILAMGQVYRINNIGLNALISMYNRATNGGYKVALSNLNTGVIKYLHLLGYADYFPIVRSSLRPENTFI